MIFSNSRVFKNEKEMTDYCLSKMYAVKMAIFETYMGGNLKII